ARPARGPLPGPLLPVRAPEERHGQKSKSPARMSSHRGDLLCADRQHRPCQGESGGGTRASRVRPQLLRRPTARTAVPPAPRLRGGVLSPVRPPPPVGSGVVTSAATLHERNASPTLSGSLSACGEGWGEAVVPLQSPTEISAVARPHPNPLHCVERAPVRW